jgi:hypothetical protein
MTKLIHFQIVASADPSRPAIYALDSDGQLWLGAGVEPPKWEKIPVPAELAPPKLPAFIPRG